MQGRLRTALEWMPSIVWMGLIFWTSALPVSGGGGLSPIVHVLEFAALGALLLVPLRRGRLGWIVAWASASVYGAADELHQWFVPNRMTDPGDWMLDTGGALIGVAVTILVMRVLAARRAARTHP